MYTPLWKKKQQEEARKRAMQEEARRRAQQEEARRRPKEELPEDTARTAAAESEALSQLSRSVESRQVKRPMLSDLRESGSLEQDADIVMFLYREDYYDKDTENKNITEIIVAKHRNGPVDSVQLFFQKEYTKFRDLLMQ